MIIKKSHSSFPTVIVILGATGDLMGRKIVPSLFDLFSKNKLPPLTHIIGFSRRPLTKDQFREYVGEMVQKYHSTKKTDEILTAFLSRFDYQQGTFGEINQYRALATRLGNIDGEWKTCANKLFYLAVPPQHYETIFNNLAETGLTKPCSPDEGWTRVLVEKPFGKNAKSAQQLDHLLGTLFKEEQIYRIDHYLAKEMLQNILNFRFANNLFEKSWSRETIEKVEIRLWENLGVEHRGMFYDGIGALRDVGQNHLLQMLALTTMEEPLSFTPEAIREKRAQILSTIEPPVPSEVNNVSYRAQYKQYTDIADVSPTSTTETFFRLKLYLNADRWLGVPFTIESGKRMGQVKKEIMITFKSPAKILYPRKHIHNKITIMLEPDEGISITFLSKKPGLEFDVEEKKLHFELRKQEDKQQYIEEYEKLLMDAINGDQTLFVSTKEVQEMWRVIDPVVTAWEKNKIPLPLYQPDTTDAVLEADKVTVFSQPFPMNKKIGIIGLGKMGTNLARQLTIKNWNVVGYNRTLDVTKKLEEEGIEGAYSLREFINCLQQPRIIWLMLPAGKALSDLLFGLTNLSSLLTKGDIIIDGSNSFYKDSRDRANLLKKKGIIYLDVGVSGGPSGALNGASLMVGGSKNEFEKLKPLFFDLAVPHGVMYAGKSGAGHFVKMVHNGIEYGMMQAIAEGFTLLKESDYRFNLKDIAHLYNHGTVIDSRLMWWLKKAYEEHGDSLASVSSTVAQTGEGQWTVDVAKQMKIPIPVILNSVEFRSKSSKKPSYTGKILSALRQQFGGHKA